MANNTFVGFNLPTTGQSSTQSEVVKELQPVTTWSRDGNYKVTRRWRGPIDSLIAFSNGGSTNADFAGLMGMIWRRMFTMAWLWRLARMP